MNANPDFSQPLNLTASQREREPLAIIGIGCRFPGAADNAVEFWKLLCDGVDAITDVPPDRWNIGRFYDPDPEKPGTTYIRQGGFIKQPLDRFDALFFGISPREAACIDPQQRLLLEVTWEALEDAGQVPDQLAGTDVGVYIGGFTFDSKLMQMSVLNRDLISSHTATSATLVMLSNRISYTFDFRGPSLSIDTACSSSLVALNYACQDLWQGRCSLAVAGGVNVMLRPEYPMIMAKGGFLASDGRCKTFSGAANGYARGEGAGVVILKPLAAAESDGDPIYALIRGTGVNQDGRTNGITVPNGEAQQALIRRVQAEAGCRPSALSYIEAHGTGTAVGDPIETAAYGAVFAEAGRPAGQPCLIGSVKANIGHLEAAAGVAGVIKAALCLKHRQVPPQVHAEWLNPKIPFAQHRLRVPRQIEPLPRQDGQALACVNSFGYGGTNAHVLLQEAPEPPAADAAPGAEPARAQLLPLSARSSEALCAMAQAYLDQASDQVPVPPLAALAGTMATRRAHHGHRLAIVAETPAEFAKQLRVFLAAGQDKDIATGQVAHGQTLRPVFVFTGMGPQWWGMGQELFATEPVYRRAAEEADAAFQRHSGWSILQEMLDDEAGSRMAATGIAQPANFVLQVALAALWRSWGIEPEAIVGHSVGEVSAAYVSGALDLEDAACVSFHRSRLQQRMAGFGRMLAVGLPAEKAKAFLEDDRDQVAIAAINSPSAVTFAGDPEPLVEIAKRLEAEQVFNSFLHVEVAYHSPQMNPLREELLDSLQGLCPRSPAVPLYSTVTGDRIEGAEIDASYWWRNVRQTVRFADAASRLVAEGHALFLEVGPHPVLATAIRDSLRRHTVPGEVLSSLVRGQPERATLLQALGRMYCRGYPMDWKRLYPAGSRPPVRLPAYPWQREVYWTESVASRLDRLGSGEHALLGIPQRSPVPAWEADLSPVVLPYLKDHRIQNAVVFPGAGYVEAALAAQRVVSPDRAGVIEGIEFHSALTIGAHEKVSLRTEVNGRRDTVTLYSRVAGEESDWRLHATGRLSQAVPCADRAGLDLAAIRRRCGTPEDPAEFYRQLAVRGLQYGPYFQPIRRLWLGAGEVLAEIEAHPELKLDEAHDQLHPTLLDASFQALIGALPDTGGEIYIPTRIERISLLARPSARVWSHGRITRRLRDALIADITLCDDEGRVLARLRGLRCQALAGKADGTDRLKQLGYAYRWEASPPELRPEAAIAPVEPAITATGTNPGGAGRWLVFADRRGVGDTLADLLALRGAACLRVRCGDGTGPVRTGAGEMRTPAQSMEDLARVLSEASVEQCCGIAYFWSLDVGDDDPLGEEACTRLLYLVQALAQYQSPEKPHLHLLTRCAQNVIGAVAGTNRPVEVAQASLWGLGRVIINEHPELRCTLIDLDANAQSGSVLADELLRETLSGSRDEEIAFRGTERHVHRLQRIALDGEETEAAPLLQPAAEPFVLEIARPGNLDGLRFRATERQAPGRDEVELRIDAFALNFKDVLKLLGTLPETVTDGTFFGSAIGMEAAATVMRVGEGVTALRPGDRIICLAGGGCVQSYVTVPLNRLFWAPALDSFNSAELSGMPVAFVTAVYGLRDVARLQPGEKVLLHSATGGVGLAAIQVARQLGAEIYVTAGSAEKRDYLRSLGIAHIMDSRTLDFADEILTVTDGRGVDVVLNFLPGEALEKSIAVLAPFGRLVEIGKRDIAENNSLLLGAFNRNLTFAAVDVDRLLLERPEASRQLLANIWQDLAAGRYRPLPCRMFPIAELAEACRLMMQARHMGKIVVTLENQEVSVLPPLRREAPLFRADGSYLITGGFGGFGLEVAKWMVEEGARHLVLVGRRGAATPEARATLRQLEQKGARVRAITVDITQEPQVTVLLDEIAATLPPLRGIFHAAMVLDDRMLVQLDPASFARVMAPKAGGAWLLHRLTGSLPLDHFVLFSSVAALVGNPGQGSYVAANVFLDALAQHRRAIGLPGVSINWGVLGEVGVAARDEAVAQHLERLGMRSLAPQQAVAALGRVLQRNPVQIGVIDLEWGQWGQANPLARQSLRFAHLIGDAGAGDDETESLLRLLLASAPEEREAAMTALLAEEIARVLRMPVARLDVHEPLSRLGVDSLIVAELQIALQSQLGIEVSVLELIRGISIVQLARQALAKLNILDAAPADKPGAGPVLPAAGTDLAATAAPQAA